MQEVALKTHLIIKDIHDEYNINWCGKIANVKPKIKNGKPVFIIIGTRGRIEANTADMASLEHKAKLLTQPKGRTAVSTDSAYIYIQDIEDKEILMGVLQHNRVKTFAPMYDKVKYY